VGENDSPFSYQLPTITITLTIILIYARHKEPV